MGCTPYAGFRAWLRFPHAQPPSFLRTTLGAVPAILSSAVAPPKGGPAPRPSRSSRRPRSSAVRVRHSEVGTAKNAWERHVPLTMTSALTGWQWPLRVSPDFDHDGDQDIFAELGGAYAGDVFGNALFDNPFFGNHWLAAGTSRRCSLFVGRPVGRFCFNARCCLDKSRRRCRVPLPRLQETPRRVLTKRVVGETPWAHSTT